MDHGQGPAVQEIGVVRRASGVCVYVSLQQCVFGFAACSSGHLLMWDVAPTVCAALISPPALHHSLIAAAPRAGSTGRSGLSWVHVQDIMSTSSSHVASTQRPLLWLFC